MRKTRIVVPCYNEATRLDQQAFLDALANEGNLSFLFVNDGSTDGTLTILEAIQAKRSSQVAILNLPHNTGKAEAVRRGMLEALAGPFDTVGYWDADLATPLDTIGNFCCLLDDAGLDIVIGSRVLLLGRKIERRVARHYLGRVFATFTSLLLGIRVYDTQCGAKLFRKTESLRQVFSKPFKVTWIFDVEMLARFSIVMGTSPQEASSRWVEHPLDEWIDVTGSKVKTTDFFRSGLEFALLFFLLRTSARRRYEKYLGLEEPRASQEN